MAFIEAAECSNPAATSPSNAGVAGAGILLSFMITACLALILSASVILSGFRDRKSIMRRKLLNGYSDSQILQGIGIQSVGLARMNTLIPYHFFLIWMLSLLTMATHNAALLALIQDYRRDWVLRWMRQFLMFVNLALSSVSGIFVLQSVSKGLGDKTLPIACVWQINGDGPAKSSVLSYAGTIIVIAANCITFALATWYLHRRNQKFYKVVQGVGLIVMTGAAVGAAVRICLLSQAFGHPDVALSDQGEKEWSFGQLLSLLILLFPLVSVIEIYRGEIKVAPALGHSSNRLYDGELQSSPPHATHTSFQPNPFFGSQTNLFGKAADGSFSQGK